MAANPYAGGDVVFNSTPFTQIYLQDLQRKKARRDALEQYYNNLTTNINTAGVRNPDINDIAQKTNDWRNFYAQNRDKIADPRKDNYKALTEFQQRHQDILNSAAKSKNEAAVDMELGKQLFALKQNDTVTQEDLDIADKRNKFSIFQPEFYKEDGHTPYGLSDFTIGAAMPTQEKIDHFLDSLKGANLPTSTFSKPEYIKGQLPFQYNERKTETIAYDKNTLNNIVGGALGYKGDKSFERYFQHQYEQPHVKEQLDPLFKATYGYDIGAKGDGAGDVAKAMALARYANPQTKISDKDVSDTYGREMALQKQRQSAAAVAAKSKADAKKGDDSNNAQVIEKYVTDNFDTPSKQRPITVQRNGTTRTEYLVPNTPELIKVLSNGKLQPDAVHTYKENGKQVYEGVFYKRNGDKLALDKNGRVLIDQKWTTRKSRDGLKLSVGNEIIGIKNAYNEATNNEDNQTVKDGFDPKDIQQFGGTIR